MQPCDHDDLFLSKCGKFLEGVKVTNTIPPRGRGTFKKKQTPGFFGGHGKDKFFSKSGIYGDSKDWSNNKELINRWINGETNEPFVNANMKELSQTGFMSNRGRQNVANYLTKELKIDWRIGAEYFESLLIDYDVHSNYGNWLYNAGIGNDSMPFRKFSPKLQSERYDPNKEYEKLWLNE